jgi:transcriptional regulator with XRE-family HTH domain
MRPKNKSLPHPRKAREARGLSQRELAALVPTTQSSVFKWEKDGTYPKHASLRSAYLRALGLEQVAP